MCVRRKPQASLFLPCAQEVRRDLDTAKHEHQKGLAELKWRTTFQTEVKVKIEKLQKLLYEEQQELQERKHKIQRHEAIVNEQGVLCSHGDQRLVQANNPICSLGGTGRGVVGG